MRVRFLQALAGIRDAYRPGDEVELNDAIAVDLLRKEVVEVIRQRNDLEHAVVAAPEQAALPGVRRRRRNA